MPQTLLAICAIMAAALFSLNLQRSTLDARVKMLGMEASTQATEVGTRVLEYIGSRSFDRTTIGGIPVSSPSQLTLRQEFGSNLNFAACQAIEDFHDMKPFRLKLNDIEYEVTAEVRYVTQENNVTTISESQTYMKEVVIEVDNKFLQAPIRLSRVFTY